MYGYEKQLPENLLLAHQEVRALPVIMQEVNRLFSSTDDTHNVTDSFYDEYAVIAIDRLWKQLSLVEKHFLPVEQQFICGATGVCVFGEVSAPCYHSLIYQLAKHCVCHIQSGLIDLFSDELSEEETDIEAGFIDMLKRCDLDYFRDDWDELDFPTINQIEQFRAELIREVCSTTQIRTDCHNAPIATNAAVASENPWQFPHDGKAIYKQVEMSVAGIRWKVLKALAEADGPLSADNLIEVAWDHDSVSTADNLKPHISAIRTLLRRKLSLGDNDDPIPHHGKGETLAWSLDSSLRLSMD